MLGAGLAFLALGFVLSYRAVYAARMVQDAVQADDSGRYLVASYAKMSLLALALFLPPLGIMSVAEDRAKRRLELLLTTPVPAAIHSAAKLLAPLSVAFLSIAGMLPLSMLAMILGGIGPDEVIYLTCAQADTAFMAAAIGMWAGSRTRSLAAGLTAAYGVLSGALMLVAAAFADVQSRGRARHRCFRLVPFIAGVGDSHRGRLRPFIAGNCTPYAGSGFRRDGRRAIPRPRGSKRPDFYGARDIARDC